jgi:serine/threonine-protein kinase PRP4
LISNLQIRDEATLIEERRQKREAIKAKYRSSTGTLPEGAPSSDVRLASDVALQLSRVPSMKNLYAYFSTCHSCLPAPPLKTRSPTPKDDESPVALVVSKDYLVNGRAAGAGPEDEPSAADYDPTTDMQEDQLRHNKRHWGDDVSSVAYEEKSGFKQDVLLPESTTEDVPRKVPKDEFDMFAEEDELDMFAQAPESDEPHMTERKSAKAVPIPQAKALDMSMLDDWDDPEGYYKVILGELLDGRYHVQSSLGKGMFSGVVRATDQKTTRLVAIKLIRNNETM